MVCTIRLMASYCLKKVKAGAAATAHSLGAGVAW